MGKTTTEQQPPEHLTPEAAAWWSAIVAEWRLTPGETATLTAAAETLDRISEARQAIAEDGAYLADRFGQKRAHPALSVERLQRLALARLLKTLKLPDEPVLPAKRQRRH
jgi:phage terminase small subunit